MKIHFIGFGNMAKAIARGLLKQTQYTLSASAPSLTAGTNKDGIKTHHNNKELIKGADVLILAVKPGLMAEVLEEITPVIPDNCLLISVAAGLNTSWFAHYVGTNQALIRSMPNTPAAIGLAATPLFANEQVTKAQKQCAEDIFSYIGITTWAQNENDLDTFTALSGSGPAYVFLFIEALIQAAVSMGLNEPIAKLFTLQTVEGALNLAKYSDLSVTELKTKVTSPGGTTAAALNILEPQLSDLIFSALKAAKIRSQELGTT